MGIDAEDGGPGGHGPIAAYQAVAQSILNNVTNGGSGILVFGCGKSESDHVTDFWDAIGSGTGQSVTCVNGDPSITSQSLAGYAMIGIASDQFNTPSGGLTNDENSALAGQESAIASFVNGGGGLLGFSQCSLTNPYAYLGGIGAFSCTALGTNQQSNIAPTTEGTNIGITDDLDICCWHDAYATFPAFLQPLATYPNAGNQIAAIGGAQVVITTDLVLSPAAATNPVGTLHSVTATVTETVGGVTSPLEDVTVYFDVTGANTASGSCDTDANGQCSFSYTGNNVGDDTIEATVFLDEEEGLFATASKTWEVLDFDADGVLDNLDNCPFVYNPLQEDSDIDANGNPNPDGVGDACDNCPKLANADQADTDGDRVGNACEGVDETLQVPSGSTRPGDACFVTATFENNTGGDIVTIRPDCFNTTFTVLDPITGLPLPPRYRERAAYRFPDDLVSIPPGPFSVTCQVCGEMFDPSVLTSGPGGTPKTYDIEATYGNDHQDPDIDRFTGQCLNPPCINVFIGAVTSTPGQLVIEGDPVVTKTAECSFAPSQLSGEWAGGNGPDITVQVSDIMHHSAGDVDLTSIQVNGVPIIPGSASANTVVTAQINGTSLVQSLGTAVPGTYFPTVRGAFSTTPDEVFSAQCAVTIALLDGLPKGQGFWKNHSELIQGLLAPPLQLGTQVVDTVPAALDILNNSKGKNMNDKLRAVLLATLLNRRAGAPQGPCIQPTINAAQTFLEQHGDKDLSQKQYKALKQEAEGLKDPLEAYNNQQAPCF